MTTANEIGIGILKGFIAIVIIVVAIVIIIGIWVS
jgi:hypothetical protein